MVPSSSKITSPTVIHLTCRGLSILTYEIINSEKSQLPEWKEFALRRRRLKEKKGWKVFRLLLCLTDYPQIRWLKTLTTVFCILPPGFCGSGFQAGLCWAAEDKAWAAQSEAGKGTGAGTSRAWSSWGSGAWLGVSLCLPIISGLHCRISVGWLLGFFIPWWPQGT